MNVLKAFDMCADRDNSVALSDMRKLCPMSRQVFDAELRKLRIAGVLCLSASDREVSPEVSDGAVVENDELLAYASRR